MATNNTIWKFFNFPIYVYYSLYNIKNERTCLGTCRDNSKMASAKSSAKSIKPI